MFTSVKSEHAHEGAEEELGRRDVVFSEPRTKCVSKEQKPCLKE